MSLFLSASAANGPLSGTLIQGFTDAEHKGGAFSPDGTKIAVLSRRVNDAGGGTPRYGVDIYTSSSIGWTTSDYISQFDLVPDLGNSEFHWMEWYSNSEIYLRNTSNIYRVLSGSGGWSVSSDSPIGGSGFAANGTRFKFNPSKTKILNYASSNKFGISESGSEGWANFSTYTPSGLSGNSNAKVRSAVWVSDTEVAVGIPMFVNGNEADSKVSVFSSSSASGFTETDSITDTSGKHLGSALYYHDKSIEYKFLVGAGRSNADNNWLLNEGLTTRGANWYIYKSASSTGYFGSTVRTITSSLVTPVGSNLEVDPNDSDRFIVPSLNTGSIGGLGNAGSEIYAFEFSFHDSVEWNNNWHVSIIYTGSSHDGSAGGRIGFNKNGEILVNHRHSNDDDMVMLFAAGNGVGGSGCSEEYDVCHQVQTDTRIINHITASNAGASSNDDRKRPNGGSVSPNGCRVAVSTNHRNGADGNSTDDHGIDIYTSGASGWTLSDSFGTTGEIDFVQWRTDNEIWYYGQDTATGINNLDFIWMRTSGSSGWSNAAVGAGRNNANGYFDDVRAFVFNEQKDVLVAWEEYNGSSNTVWAIYYSGSQTANTGIWDGVKFRRTTPSNPDHNVSQIVPGHRVNDLQTFYLADTIRNDSGDPTKVWAIEVDLDRFGLVPTTASSYDNAGVLEHHAAAGENFPWLTNHYNATTTDIENASAIGRSSATTTFLLGGLLYWHSASNTILVGESPGSIDTSTSTKLAEGEGRIDFFSPRIENKIYQYSSGASGFFSNRVEILPHVEKHRMDNTAVQPAFDDKRIFFGFTDGTNSSPYRRGGLSCLESGSDGWKLTYLAAPEYQEGRSPQIGYASGTLVYNDSFDSLTTEDTKTTDITRDGVFTIEQFTNLTGSCEAGGAGDSAGFTLGTGSLFLTESQNGTASVVLDAQPTSNVVITASLHSDFDGRATLTNHVITFTTANWDTPQFVQVTASDDNLINGDVGPQNITFSIVDNDSDDDFDGLSDQFVALTVFDNDVAGFTLGTASLFLTESQNATASVVLNARPDSNVVITASLHSDFNGRATLTNHLITFQPANWNVPQFVEVTASDDSIVNGDVGPQNITFSVVDASSDNNFDGISNTIALTVFDNDAPNFTLGVSSLGLTESHSSSVSVVLDKQPAGNVQITASLHSDFNGRATLTNHVITFTTANWDTPQFVQVTASDDNLVNGDVGPQNITFSIVQANTDAGYDNVADKTVAFTVVDNDVAGFTVGTGSLSLVEGQNNTASVVLDAKPVSNVVITASLHSNFNGRATLTNHLITFTTDNWNVPQFLQVTASDDSIVNGDVGPNNITFSVVNASSDNNFDNISRTCSLTVIDNDTPDFTLGVSSLGLTESHSSSVSVVLDKQPAGNVQITASLHPDFNGRATLTNHVITFTTANWDTPQFVQVTASDDNLINGNVGPQNITFSIVQANTDAGYDDVANKTVAFTVVDNDVAGFTLGTGSLFLTESQNATASVVLNARPNSNVVITASLHSNFDDRATLTNHLITFTNANWNVPQFVQVTASDDNLINGDVGPNNITFSVVDASSDNNFDGISNTIALTVFDNDSAGITINTGSLFLTEGQNGTASVVLNAKPNSNVVITASLHSDFDGSATLTNHVITFTPANWDAPQILQVTASDDNLINVPNSVTENITFSVVNASSDNNFDNIAQTCSLTVTNDDTAGFTLGTGSLILREEQNDTITVVLTAQPSSNVVITASLHSDFDERATLTNHLITFTTANWDTPQILQVTASQDTLVNGDVGPKPITFEVVDGSSDSAFHSVQNQTASLTIEDDDSGPRVDVDPARLAAILGGADVIVTETGGEGQVNIRLGTEPTHNVTITISGIDSTEFDMIEPENINTLVFTPGNFNENQIIRFRGKPDDVSDPVTITNVLLTAASTDGDYNALTKTIKVKCVEVNTDGAPPCNLVSTDYTINYYTCALSQYNHHKTLPFRIGGAKNTSNIREQDFGNSHKTFLGEQKT